MLKYILLLCFRTLIRDCIDMLSVYTYVYFTLYIYVAVASPYSVRRSVTDFLLGPPMCLPVHRLCRLFRMLLTRWNTCRNSEEDQNSTTNKNQNMISMSNLTKCLHCRNYFLL